MLHTAASLSRLDSESAFQMLARAQALAAEGKDIINLGIGQPNFRRLEHFVEAEIKAFCDEWRVAFRIDSRSEWWCTVFVSLAKMGDCYDEILYLPRCRG